MLKIQDWEFAEQTGVEEWETVDIQFSSEVEAVTAAQAHANRTRRPCLVTTSIRLENEDGVQDRGLAPGDPPGIWVYPS